VSRRRSSSDRPCTSPRSTRTRSLGGIVGDHLPDPWAVHRDRARRRARRDERASGGRRATGGARRPPACGRCPQGCACRRWPRPWPSRGGRLRRDPVVQPGGDASRHLIGQHVEVEVEPQCRLATHSDDRKVGTQP
jgi:hypothetical protein